MYRRDLATLKSKNFMQVDEVDLHNFHHIIQIRVTQMYSECSIDKDTYRYLCGIKPSLKCDHLYLLPKIHKNQRWSSICPSKQHMQHQATTTWPIILQCDTQTRKIGAQCDYFLIPIVQNQSIPPILSKKLRLENFQQKCYLLHMMWLVCLPT